jgi:predicted nucleic acid-binding protein
VTRCYLDTNFIYAHLRSRRDESAPVEAWRQETLAVLGADRASISALVVDELAYRLVLAWLRDDGDDDPLSTYRDRPRAVMHAARARLTATWDALDALQLDLVPTDLPVVVAARQYMAEPGLAPRDAFHLAHAVSGSCPAIVSSDPAFDDAAVVRRIGPPVG